MDTPVEDFFENLLINNKTVFHDSRTAGSLECQWNLLKDLHLLTGQLSDMSENSDDEDTMALSFKEVEDRLDDKLIQENVKLNTESDNVKMLKSYQSLLTDIKRSEADIFLWQVLVDKITDRPNPFADVETLAILFSENIEFKMIKKEVNTLYLF